MGFILFNIFLLFGIFLLLLLLSAVWPPDSPWSPWWKTDEQTSRSIGKLADIKKGDILYELGSGNGTTLFIAAKEFGARGVGIEIDPLRAVISRILLRFHGVAGKVRIHKKSFFDADISDATVIYVYLIPKALKKLQKKFENELQPGTRLVSLVYPIPYLPLKKEDQKQKLFLYIIPNAPIGKKKG